MDDSPKTVLAGTCAQALLACVVMLCACSGASAKKKSTVASAATHVSACTLMPKEEISRITGDTYTNAESNDDGKASESSCHYSTPTNPAGISLDISWITPHDYSDEVEHVAIQKAMIGGAKLGGSLVSQTLGGATMPGLRSGPVDGVGDEANQNLLLLTARKGDYKVMIQIYPQDMIKLMTDSAFVIGVVGKEKEIARQALSRL